MNAPLKTYKTSLLFLLIGIGLAFFSLTPQGIYLEEEFGLPWLFKLRGSIPTSENIIIVSIDEISAQILQLPDDPKKWPRSYYAQLINKINLQNPSIIAFNMTFDEPRNSEDDQKLAEAMATSRNTILSNYLRLNKIPSPDLSGEVQYESIINPIQILEQAALGTAPFPIPKTATTVKQFFAYKRSAGDIATFPVTVFQCFVFKQAYPEILQLLRQLNPEYDFQVPDDINQLINNFDGIKTMQKMQTLFADNLHSIEETSQLIDSSNFSAEKKYLLKSWLTLLLKPNLLYFNYYGPAETFTTVPFYQALASDILNPTLFKNKIVLIGHSKSIQSEKNRGLYTVFSNSGNGTTSPIEIAGTAIANLIDNTWLKPLQPINQFMLIIGWSILLSATCRLFTFKQVIILIITLALCYIALAYTRFGTASTWMPIFIPITLQIPLLLTLVSIVHFFRGKKEHQNMQQAFSLYIPDDIVSSFAQDHDINATIKTGKLMQGVCMATDAGQYTTLSENMEPDQLHNLINNYYAVMFPQVKQNKGIISDVVGDAMFAIWTDAEHETQVRTNACLTALEIKSAIARFNRSQPYQLPTRLGLHYGNFRLGNVGAAGHFEFRAVGDTVNTAARIEGLNKLLGTQILVTAEIIIDLPDFFTREIGFFILKGKNKAVHIYELMGKSEQHLPNWQAQKAKFAKALLFFQQQQWTQALEAWQDIERVSPSDGPTLFYINYLKRNIDLVSTQQSNDNSPTVIKI